MIMKRKEISEIKRRKRRLKKIEKHMSDMCIHGICECFDKNCTCICHNNALGGAK